MPITPEDRARENIDELLTGAGWIVQDKRATNLSAGRGVAVREFPLRPGHGEADYLLFVDGAPIGVVEAKKEGDTLTGVELQTTKYSEGIPNGAYEHSYLKLGKFRLSAIGQTAYYSETPLPGGSIASQGAGDTGIQIADWLGTIRGNSNYTGGVLNNTLSRAPFGEAYAVELGAGESFAGQEGDNNRSKTIYWFPERQYVTTEGRFLSPDPAGFKAANPANPQAWNRYSYVQNNPLSRVDPSGLNDINVSDAPWYGPGNYAGGGWGTPDFGSQSGPGDPFGIPPSVLNQELRDAAAEAESRYGSIIATGWDPDLQRQYTETNYWFTGGDGSILEQQKELAALTLGQRACDGQDPSAVAGCIQSAYDTLQLRTPAGEKSPLVGGNYNFDYKQVIIPGADISADGLGCVAGRCGISDSLHFHSDGTFHVDTANPFFFPVGSLAHLGWDVVGGNTVWSGGIPRPWW
jgi:RHS repeat-associated protein